MSAFSGRLAILNSCTTKPRSYYPYYSRKKGFYKVADVGDYDNIDVNSPFCSHNLKNNFDIARFDNCTRFLVILFLFPILNEMEQAKVASTAKPKVAKKKTQAVPRGVPKSGKIWKTPSTK